MGFAASTSVTRRKSADSRGAEHMFQADNSLLRHRSQMARVDRFDRSRRGLCWLTYVLAGLAAFSARVAGAQAQPDPETSYQEALNRLVTARKAEDIAAVRQMLSGPIASGDPRALNLMGLTYDPMWRMGSDSSATESARFYGAAAAKGYDAANHNLRQLQAKGWIKTSEPTPTPERLRATSAPARTAAATVLPESRPTLETSNTSSAPVAAGDGPSIFALVAPAVVELRAGDSYGSGVLVGQVQTQGNKLMISTKDSEGGLEARLPQARGPVDLFGSGVTYVLVVTNAHVVHKGTSVLVGLGVQDEGESQSHVQARAVCLSQNPQEDLAFVLVDVTAVPENVRNNLGFAKIYSSDGLPAKGSVVYALGNPEGLTRTITQGLYNGLRAEGIQFDAPISVGSSGGALVDVDGQLLGITSGFVANKDSQNLNFALPAAQIIQNLALGQSLCRPL
jgi:S1-C subfamily serine protease